MPNQYFSSSMLRNALQLGFFALFELNSPFSASSVYVFIRFTWTPLRWSKVVRWHKFQIVVMGNFNTWFSYFICNNQLLVAIQISEADSNLYFAILLIFSPPNMAAPFLPIRNHWILISFQFSGRFLILYNPNSLFSLPARVPANSRTDLLSQNWTSHNKS